MSSEGFKQSGTAVGVEIWRVENLQPVPATADGQLYSGVLAILLTVANSHTLMRSLLQRRCRSGHHSVLSDWLREDSIAGDAYVLLSTSQQGTSSSLLHEIHFWIGKECSQDEGAGAAMLAVQLDNALSTRGSDAAISRYRIKQPSSPCSAEYLCIPQQRRSRHSGGNAVPQPLRFCKRGDVR